MEAESRMVFVGVGMRGKWGGISQRVEFQLCKMAKFLSSTAQYRAYS